MPIFHSWETKEFEGYLLRKIKTEAGTRDLSKKVKLPAHNEYDYDESPHEEEADGQVGERFKLGFQCRNTHRINRKCLSCSRSQSLAVHDSITSALSSIFSFGQVVEDVPSSITRYALCYIDPKPLITFTVFNHTDLMV